MNSTANSRQVDGDHYASPNQHWDWVEKLRMNYLAAQITKYVVRWRKKNLLVDLCKAKHFLEKLIEVECERTSKVKEETDHFTKDNKVPELESRILRHVAMSQTARMEDLLAAQTILSTLMEQYEQKQH